MHLPTEVYVSGREKFLNLLLQVLRLIGLVTWSGGLPDKSFKPSHSFKLYSYFILLLSLISLCVLSINAYNAPIGFDTQLLFCFLYGFGTLIKLTSLFTIHRFVAVLKKVSFIKRMLSSKNIDPFKLNFTDALIFVNFLSIPYDIITTLPWIYTHSFYGPVEMTCRIFLLLTTMSVSLLYPCLVYYTLYLLGDAQLRIILKLTGSFRALDFQSSSKSGPGSWNRVIATPVTRAGNNFGQRNTAPKEKPKVISQLYSETLFGECTESFRKELRAAEKLLYVVDATTKTFIESCSVIIFMLIGEIFALIYNCIYSYYYRFEISLIDLH